MECLLIIVRANRLIQGGSISQNLTISLGKLAGGRHLTVTVLRHHRQRTLRQIPEVIRQIRINTVLNRLGGIRAVLPE